MSALAPLLVAGPLAAAALITALYRFLPRAAVDAVALATTLAVAAGAAALTLAAGDGPRAVWLGGWAPRDGAAFGIALVPDVLGAGFALLIAVLMLAVLVFSRLYFARLRGLFHALLMVFLGAATGYCLTGDLFNLYVFFELVGVTAFVLTAFRMEEDALHGAMTFAVVNSLASILLLGGIGVLYALAGTINLAELSRALAETGDSGAVRLAFVLIMAGFLIKSAAVPFHFWLTDAYAGAAAPVCVLFGGASVTLGVFGAARVLWTAFGGDVLPPGTVPALFWPVGVVTALYAGVMALVEPNLKRVLALTTVSHVGVLLVAIGAQSAEALGGGASYLLGHAFAKAALFVCAGVVILRAGTAEIGGLAGSGRAMLPAAALIAVGGLMLAGLPGSAIHGGKSAIQHALGAVAGGGALAAALNVAAVLSGAAVLHAAARLVAAAPAGDAGGRPRFQGAMTLIAAVLLALAAAAALPGAAAGIDAGARDFVRTADLARTVLDAAPFAPSSAPPRAASLDAGAFAPPLAAAALAAALLWRRRLPGPLAGLAAAALAAAGRLHRLHTGHVGDYIAWTVAGVCAMGLALGALSVAP